MKLVNLTAKLTKYDATVDVVALVDVLLLALMFILLASRYMLAPGLVIESIPVSSTPDYAVVDSSIDVLNAKGSSMIIYGGKIHSAESFGRLMGTMSKTNKAKTLLIKTDKTVDSQSLIEICDYAKNGGYEKILIATRKDEF